MTTINVTLGFCALSFLLYGSSCLYSTHMADEFIRYRLSRFRVTTGILQILAALGLTLGMIYPWMGGIAAIGIALQMLCGLCVRLRIGDTWLQCMPATFYLLLCSWLAIRLL